MTSTGSRRAFLAGSAVAAGGLAIAGRFARAAAHSATPSQRGIGAANVATASAEASTMPLLLDLPRPPGDNGQD